MAYYEGAAKKKPAPREIEVRACRAPGCRAYAFLSDDLGKTWFCPADAPADFWPHARGAALSVDESDDII